MPADGSPQPPARRWGRRVAISAGGLVLAGAAVYGFLRVTEPGRERPMAPPSQLTGQIAFVSDRTGQNQIHVMNADGTGARRLTGVYRAYAPEWSPDGTRLAFEGFVDAPAADREDSDVFVLDVGTGEVSRLTRWPGHDGDPEWSPDGTRIAFARWTRIGPRGWQRNADLMVMDADGGGVRRLTFQPGDDTGPAWAPDGSSIFFHSSVDSFVMCPPDWSCSTGPLQPHLAVVPADGSSEPTRVHGGLPPTTAGTWSPDGTERLLSRQLDIVVESADGSRQTRLTDARLNGREDENRHPDWSPDGRLIVFAHYEAEQGFDLYVMRRDGSHWQRLTDHPGTDFFPAWQPAG